MSLKRSKVVANTTATTTAKAVNALPLAGNLCQVYGKAAADEKLAKFTKEVAAKAVKETVEEIFTGAACKAAQVGAEVPSSLKFIDQTGTIIGYQFKDAYSAVSAETAEELCAELRVNGRRADVNEYFHEIPTVKFDTDVFMTNGLFDESKFLKLQRALDAAVVKLGIANPLSCANVVKPRDTFHARRFKDFGPEVQKRISEAVPNTTALTVSVLTDTALEVEAQDVQD